jgi:hypothetical protein
MLAYKPDWVQVPDGPGQRFDIYPQESLEDWHRARGLLAMDSGEAVDDPDETPSGEDGGQR